MIISENQKESMIEAGYSAKSIDFFLNRVNYGKIENPDLFTYELGSCVEIVFLYLI